MALTPPLITTAVSTAPLAKRGYKAAEKLIQEHKPDLSDLYVPRKETGNEDVDRLSKYARKSGRQGAVGAPGQQRGFSQRTYRSNVYKTEAEAEAAFRRQRSYLLRPGGWNNNSPGLSYADAPNWSHHGKEGKNQPVQAGDVLKIEAPMKSDYFVGIERVTDMNDNVQFTVRPCKDPRLGNTRETTHFFNNGSTRTFALQRMGKEVIFSTQGRNEQLNNGSQSGPFKVINSLAGTGIIAGGGNFYWDKFADGVMNK